MLRSFSQIHEISNLVPRVFSFSGKQEDPWGEIGQLLQRKQLTVKQKFATNNRASEQLLYWKGRIGNRKSETGIEDE